MSEDRTTGSAPLDAAPHDVAGERETDTATDTAWSPDADTRSDADATRGYGVSPVEAENPLPGGGSAAAAADGTADDGPAAETPGGADRPRWTRTGSSAGSSGAGAPTTVLPQAAGRPARPTPPRPDRPAGEPRAAARPQTRPVGRRRARLVLQRVDAWSVFLFSLVASICLGVVLFVAATALYAALSSLGVLGSLNGVLGEVAGTGTGEEVVEPFITAGRVLGATAVLAAVDVVLLTALATLGALLYNLCASLTGGIEVQLGERE